MVDANSVYSHATFYWVYVAAYLASTLYAFSAVIKNSPRYQYNGIAYFLSLAVFMLGGIVLQLLRSDLKVDYVVLSVTAIMLYVFALEMIQQTDQLTELINRRGYENYISHINEPCIILFFDIDRFKTVNDSFGHTFGDFCIAQVGKTIKATYAKYGKCFRFGGDEFCVVLVQNMSELEHLNETFYASLAQIRMQEPRLPTVSIGYAYFTPENGDILQTIREADTMMYQFKEHQHAL